MELVVLAGVIVVVGYVAAFAALVVPIILLAKFLYEINTARKLGSNVKWVYVFGSAVIMLSYLLLGILLFLNHQASNNKGKQIFSSLPIQLYRPATENYQIGTYNLPKSVTLSGSYVKCSEISTCPSISIEQSSLTNYLQNNKYTSCFQKPNGKTVNYAPANNYTVCAKSVTPKGKT